MSDEEFKKCLQQVTPEQIESVPSFLMLLSGLADRWIVLAHIDKIYEEHKTKLWYFLFLCLI